MFSQAPDHSVTFGEGEVRPNASWDRSNGHGEVVWSRGGGPALGLGGLAQCGGGGGEMVWPLGEAVQP